MSIITTHQLTKIFPKNIRAVDGIDFEVNKGEIFGFLGPNGAGKTTTIKMLNTLLMPTSGHAEIDGIDVAKRATEVRRVIGYVSQDIGVDENATGKENLTLYGRFYRLDGSTIKKRLKELIELVDLDGYENKMVKTYSGGMRRRLDLAMGLIHHPKLIFMDEPTTGLDPQTRVHVWKYIEELVKSMGITIFLTTHYLEEADCLCNRIAIIDYGKIIATGTPTELKQSIGGDVVNISPSYIVSKDCEEFIDSTRKALSAEPFVLRMQATGEEIAVYVKDAKTAVPKIMHILAEKGIEIGMLSMAHPSLDDVFLKYTGRTIHHQEIAASTHH